MALRHEVVQAGGMGDQQRGHAQATVSLLNH
jgi:hypothetical protein